MKKYWKIGLALGLSSFFALQEPFCFLFSAPGYCSISYGAERIGTVVATSLNVRNAPGTENRIIGKLSHGASAAIIGETAAGDGTSWYQIRFTTAQGTETTGFARADYLQISSSLLPAQTPDSDFESYLDSQGFPASYRQGLRELHTLYPQWIFTAQDTGLDWNEVIQNESLVGRNLVSSSSVSSWKSTAPGAYDWATSTWPGFDGSTWVAASEAIIRYYMDPRNFLNDTYIFQFLLQSYDSVLHTREGLNSLVAGTFLEGRAAVSSTYQSNQSNENNANHEGTTETPNTKTPDSSSGPGTSANGSNAQNQEEQSSEAIKKGPGFSSPGNTPESGNTMFNGTGDFSDVWVGAAPGINIGMENSGLSISLHSTETVSATIIRVGPGGNNSQSSSEGNPPQSSSKEPLMGVSPGGEEKQQQNTGTSGGLSENTYSDGTASYVDILMQAANQSGVNPYVLAAMILQEQGKAGNTPSISGASGYYNFYNFEAYASNGMSATQRGLWYASQSGSYMRPWNTADRAIIGGAIQYGQNYMQAGQNTFYLKKFNVQGNNLYKHQYMTNVEGAAAEGAKMGAAYTNAMRQTPLHFVIPVYRNMPEQVSILPSQDGSPDNRLSSLRVEGYSLTPAFGQDTLTYEVEVDGSVASVVVQASSVDAAAQISGTGVILLTSAVTEADICVTAQNKTVRTYKLRFIQNRANSQENNQASGSNPLTGPGGNNITIVN